MITSTKNQRIKDLASIIKKGKSRNAKGLFVVEGIKMFEEAPKERVEEIYVSKSFFDNYENKSEITRHKYEILSDDVYNRVSDTQTPQGILCLVKQFNYELDDILRKENPLLILCDEIKDPGNMGTILRTGEGAGVSGVIMSRESVDIYNPKTVRSTMGSIYRVPFVYVENLTEVIQRLNLLGISTYGAYLDNSNHYCDNDYNKPSAFVIGNESKGIKKENIDVISKKIKIPMEGGVESLNAAIACSILVYEAARQRRKI